ncbi:hypothetical protein GOP47_0012757, partial [Adiantum capillus-veneris]
AGRSRNKHSSPCIWCCSHHIHSPSTLHDAWTTSSSFLAPLNGHAPADSDQYFQPFSFEGLYQSNTQLNSTSLNQLPSPRPSPSTPFDPGGNVDPTPLPLVKIHLLNLVATEATTFQACYTQLNLQLILLRGRKINNHEAVYFFHLQGRYDGVQVSRTKTLHADFIADFPGILASLIHKKWDLNNLMKENLDPS